MRTLLTIPLILAFVISCKAAAQEWNRFRGENGTGATSNKSLPSEWSSTKNIAWKIDLPGAGSSSPVVSGDRIFLSCYSGYGVGKSGKPGDLEKHLVCIDAKTGKQLWNQTVSSSKSEDPYQGYISEHGYASNSPTTNGKLVFAFHGKSGVFAYDMDGKEVWQKDVGQMSSNRQWGSAASLILIDDKLIVNAAEESRTIFAFDAATGKEIWKSEASALELSYGTPAILDRKDGKKELVLGVPGEVWGMNPETGKLNWYVETKLTGNLSPSPIIEDESIYVFGGFRSSGSYRIHSGGKGNQTKSNIDWYSRSSSYVATPVLYNEKLFWIDDKGMAWCEDAKTGKQIYQERVAALKSGGRPVYASPIVADGKIFVVTRYDGTLVYSATSSFKIEAQNRIEGDDSDFNASLAVYGNQWLLRSNKALYCIGAKE